MTQRAGAIALVGLVACRFGGPRGNPDEYVALAGDAGEVEASTAGDDGGFVSPSSDALSEPDGGDAATPPPGIDATAPPSSDDASIDNAAEGGSCSPTVAVCDPVRNMGCDFLHQCDVDPSQTTIPTGQCVFPGGATDGGTCSSSIFNESCGPEFTCFGGGCRRLCFCDVDCPPGQCCSDRSGPPDFALCRPCP